MKMLKKTTHHILIRVAIDMYMHKKCNTKCEKMSQMSVLTDMK